MTTKDWKRISILLIIILFILSVISIARITEKDTLSNQPEVFSSFDSWGRNYYNEDEIIFKYYVYNFGDKEAKNLKAKCMVYKEGMMRKSIEKEIGNLASHSMQYEEMYTNFKEPITEIHTGFCFISNCSNCKLLQKEIPDFKELDNYDKSF